jgi:hypothetical protein
MHVFMLVAMIMGMAVLSAAAILVFMSVGLTMGVTMRMFMRVLVRMSMSPAAAILVLMGMGVRMAVVMLVRVVMSMIVVMVMVMMIVASVFSAAGRLLGLHGGQIEERQHDQPDAAPEHHGAEDPVRRQVVGDAATGIEVQHDAAPQQEQGDADEMNADAFGHDTEGVSGVRGRRGHRLAGGGGWDDFAVVRGEEDIFPGLAQQRHQKE